MGITGLLPFITDTQQGAIKTVSIREFKGQTAAIDGYVLLHRSTFSCAKQLFEGEDTNVFISHCMRYMDLLQKHGVRPLLVFDGAALDIKRDTERQRRDNRKAARKQAIDLLSVGKTADAYQAMARAINVTHKMALLFIQAARKRGIDSIVAPYEADAQLAYLTRAGFAHFVITEDSDLIVFGCERILFKLQLTGEGRFYDKSLLQGALCAKKIRCNEYNFDKFRIACILSGCDYIKSLHGIGLAKAWKFACITDNLENLDFKLQKMAQYLNMSSLDVNEEYIKQVKIANGAFKHQIVYDPVERRRRPLEDFHEDNGNCMITTDTVGQVEMNENESLDRALGNIDPMSGNHLDNYRPSNYIPNNSSSIWNKNRLLQSTLPTAVVPPQNHSLKSEASKTVVTPEIKMLTTSSRELEDQDIKLTTLLQKYTKSDSKVCSTVKDCYYKELYEDQNHKKEGNHDVFNEILTKNPFVKKTQIYSEEKSNYEISNNKENSVEKEVEGEINNFSSPPENKTISSEVYNKLPNINNSQTKNAEKCPFKKQRNNKYDQLIVQKRKAAENDYFSYNKNKKTKLEDTDQDVPFSQAVIESNLIQETEVHFSTKENNRFLEDESKTDTSLSTNKHDLDLEYSTAPSNFMEGNTILRKLNANIESISANDSEFSNLEETNNVIDFNFDNFPAKAIVNKEIETLCNDVDTISVQSGESDDLIPIDQMLDCILESNDNGSDIIIMEQNSPVFERYKKRNVITSAIKTKSLYSKCKRQTNLLDFFKKV